jgi:UDP-glucose 4-epimerase
MVWALIDAGEQVVVIDRLSTGFRWAIAPDARFYEGDIADAALLSKIFEENDIDAIIHFAGSVVVPDSVIDPLGYYENNTSKSRSLVAHAITAGVKFMVFSSTAAVYGTPNDSNPVRETDPLNPESPYGMSKLMTEVMLRDAAKAHEFSYSALRYFNVAGADPLGRTGQSTAGATHLIKVAVETAIGKRSSIDVFGTDYPTLDGTCVRDYIHVWDLVNAHLKALHRMRQGGSSIVANCGYGRGFSVLEVIDRVRNITGNDFTVRLVGRRVGDAVSVVADAALAKRELEWIANHNDLDEIISSAVQWERSLQRRNYLIP